MFFLFDISCLSVLAVGFFVGMKWDKWFGKNHRNLHQIYHHLGVHNQDDAMAVINSKIKV
jgi:hypothetical protein